MKQTLLQVLPFAVALPMLLLLARRRGISARENLRLVWPRNPELAAWLALWVLWIAAVEWLMPYLDEPAPAVWELGRAAIAVKIIGIVVLAPIVEEISFRGFLFRLIERTRVGTTGAAVGTAALFAAAHVQYIGAPLALVFVDGLLYGLARKSSRSLYLCIIMHAIGNAYAAYQRIHG